MASRPTRLNPWPMAGRGMDRIRDAADKFVALTRELDGRVLRDGPGIASFWSRLMTETSGLVIVDFLDDSNWDYITAARYETGDGFLQLIWRDYSDRRDGDLSELMFSAKTYGMLMRLQEVRVFASFVALRGYAMKQKEFDALLARETDEYAVERESLFRRSVYARSGHDWALWQVHVAPLFSVAILPKGVGASGWSAPKILYLLNFEVSSESLLAQQSRLAGAAPGDTTSVTECANTIRRIFESVLKVECAYRRLHPSREYPDLMLGDLVAALKKARDQDERAKLNNAVRVLNEYSHDSGFPVVRERLADVCGFIIEYTRELQAEVSTKLRPPN